MRREQQERIYGPYEHGDQWRVHIVTGRGDGRKTVYKTYPTRARAEAFIAGARDEAQGRSVRASVDAFLERMRAQGRGAGTVETAEHRLWMLLGLPANGERPLRWLNGRGTELYTASQVGHAVDTHRAALSLGKRFADWCVTQRWLRDNPFAAVEAVGHKRRGADKPMLRVDEARKLTATCLALSTKPEAVAVLTALLLGVRASEVIKRNVRDLDDGGRLLWIGVAKTDAGRRYLVVPELLRPLLLDLAADRSGDAPLFVDSCGERPTRDWMHYHVDALCKRAGVPQVGPHGLRRTHATLATEAGSTGPVVAAQLGHTTPVVTNTSYIQPAVLRASQSDRALRAITGETGDGGNNLGN